MKNIYHCVCGDYHALWVFHYDWDEEQQVTVAITMQPYSFWERLKMILRGEKLVYEVILEKEQVEQLVYQLSEFIHAPATKEDL